MHVYVSVPVSYFVYVAYFSYLFGECFATDSMCLFSYYGDS